jgi:hypothetical protein
MKVKSIDYPATSKCKITVTSSNTELNTFLETHIRTLVSSSISSLASYSTGGVAAECGYLLLSSSSSIAVGGEVEATYGFTFKGELGDEIWGKVKDVDKEVRAGGAKRRLLISNLI